MRQSDHGASVNIETTAMLMTIVATTIHKRSRFQSGFGERDIAGILGEDLLLLVDGETLSILLRLCQLPARWKSTVTV